MIFEKPSDWVNVFSQTFWLGTDICHAKLLLTLDGKWYLTELCYEGVMLYQIHPEEGWFIISHACEAYAFGVTPDLSKTIINRANTVRCLNLQWSNWYALHALLNGKFPSLNCISYISFLLFGDVGCDLPDKLRNKLEALILKKIVTVREA